MSENASKPARDVESELEDLRALVESLMASQEEERRRISRELHDEICQKLAVLEIDAQEAESRLQGVPESGCREIEKIRNALSTVSEDVRRISHELHPSMIEDLGLVPALLSLAEEFRERTGVTVNLVAQGVPKRVPLSIAMGLYRIAQEALNNAAEHARATAVNVRLQGDRDALLLQIVDSGKGFGVAERGNGPGFLRMQARARMFGGRLQVESQPGAGTQVTVAARVRRADRHSRSAE